MKQRYQSKERWLCDLKGFPGTKKERYAKLLKIINWEKKDLFDNKIQLYRILNSKGVY